MPMTAGIASLSSWVVLLGLALMLIGGFVLWACSARNKQIMVEALCPVGLEAEATRTFHTKLVKWFKIYGVGTIIVGLMLLLAVLYA